MTTITLTVAEIELLTEALRMAASRHESCSRFKPASAGPHDRKAAGMHKLRERLERKAAA